MWPALIAAGTNLLGSYLSSQSQQSNMEAAQDFAVRQARNAIRWRVEDANKAGVHPLFALGASVSQPSPISAGDTSIGSGVAAAGQNISRALMANETAPQRQTDTAKILEGLTLERASLQNDLLRSQIARLQQQGNPPVPTADTQWGIPGQGATVQVANRPIPEFGPIPPINEAQKQDDRRPLQIGGSRWLTDPRTSNMQEFEQRYGDEGPASWTMPFVIGARDFMYNWYRAYRDASPELQRRMRISIGDFR